MKVLSLFDFSGNMVRPWAEAGFTCLCYDIQHEPGMSQNGNIWKCGGDVRNLAMPEFGQYAIVFAFPPCTDLAVSGARWFQSKGLQRLIDALTLVEVSRKICEASGAPYMIENPVSTLSTYWREPDFTFDPCDYGGYLTPPGDAYTKKTCLWVGGGFAMPPIKPVFPVEGSKMHLLPPSADRAILRSATPEGFARAVFEANVNGPRQYSLFERLEAAR